MRTTATRREDPRPPPRGKPQAYVADDGYVYPTQRPSFIITIITCLLFAVLGALGVMNYLHIPYEALAQPLPTAGVATPTKAAPLPPPPPNAGGGQDTGSPSAPAEPPPPTADQAIADYNATQEARAAEFATQEAAAASEAEIEAWLAAPPSTPTPLPEPGQPGFAESFEAAPECSPFVGYLKGHPCYRED